MDCLGNPVLHTDKPFFERYARYSRGYSNPLFNGLGLIYVADGALSRVVRKHTATPVYSCDSFLAYLRQMNERLEEAGVRNRRFIWTMRTYPASLWLSGLTLVEPDADVMQRSNIPAPLTHGCLGALMFTSPSHELVRPKLHGDGKRLPGPTMYDNTYGGADWRKVELGVLPFPFIKTAAGQQTRAVRIYMLRRGLNLYDFWPEKWHRQKPVSLRESAEPSKSEAPVQTSGRSPIRRLLNWLGLR